MSTITFAGLLLIRAILGTSLGSYLSKKAANLGSREKQLVFLYLIQTVLSFVGGCLLAPDIQIDSLLIILGMFNSFGTYCVWQAYAVSMALTVPLLVIHDILAIILGYVFQGEVRYVNPLLLGGILVWTYATLIYPLRRINVSRAQTIKILPWVLLACVPYAIVNYSFRSYNVSGIDVWNYIPSYYLGSLVAMIAIWMVQGKVQLLKEGEPLPHDIGRVSTARHVLLLVALAFVNIIGTIIDYKCYGAAPLTVIQPLRQTTDVLIPVLIGVFFFKEGAHMTSSYRNMLGISLIASLMILFGFK